MFKKYFFFFFFLAALVSLWFFRSRIFIGLDRVKYPSQSFNELFLENQGLRREIKELQNKLEIKSLPYLSAQVFSRYPFNGDQNLIINVGFRDGVQVGWPVLVTDRELLGKIVKTKAGTSEVRTIFSPEWRSTVRLGQNGPEALLIGGRPPRLEFIPAEAKINPDDEVFNVLPNLPLNLYIGQVSEIISQPASSLKQAKLKTDYDPNQIRKVLIITDYEGFDPNVN